MSDEQIRAIFLGGPKHGTTIWIESAKRELLVQEYDPRRGCIEAVVKTHRYLLSCDPGESKVAYYDHDGELTQ